MRKWVAEYLRLMETQRPLEDIPLPHLLVYCTSTSSHASILSCSPSHLTKLSHHSHITVTSPLTSPHSVWRDKVRRTDSLWETLQTLQWTRESTVVSDMML
eukprot:GHVN01057407.1.p3 GENE.GHVN01057407.1~~GHVN01057407.1.p3  ORF type:complete len:101 (-),score=19.48 GHVN01057407.1:147-449(-)